MLSISSHIYSEREKNKMTVLCFGLVPKYIERMSGRREGKCFKVMCQSPAKHMSDHTSFCDACRGRNWSSEVTDDERDDFDMRGGEGRRGRTGKEEKGKINRVGKGG